jgi:hypothetical protein
LLLFIHQRDDALFGIHRTQRTPNNRLDNLLRVERSADGAGKIVEDGKFFNGAFEALVLFLEGFE